KETPNEPVKAAICRMLARSHWLAERGSHGKPLRSHVRVHSMTTHAPAKPSNASSRVGVGSPTMRGSTHQAIRNQEPTQTPTTGRSSNRPTHVTWCSHASRSVHATACAPSTTPAYSLNFGPRYAQSSAGAAKA